MLTLEHFPSLSDVRHYELTDADILDYFTKRADDSDFLSDLATTFLIWEASNEWPNEIAEVVNVWLTTDYALINGQNLPDWFRDVLRFADDAALDKILDCLDMHGQDVAVRRALRDLRQSVEK